MNIIKKSTLYLLFTLALFACNKKSQNNNENNDLSHSDKKGKHKEEMVKMVEDILTKKDQDAMTANTVLTSLKEGNQNYMKNMLTPRNYPSQAKNSGKGQYPKAIVLSCVDSRVPVENIFDQGIGDLFVARVAGNFSNVDILGSMEYACKVAGSKLVLVMGHEHCGAVKSAVQDVKLGNITALLSKIQPAIKAVKYDGDRSYKNKEFLQMVGKSNVIHTINEIRKNSPILKEMEDKGEIKIVGAIYDIESGKVSFLE